jgi:hypothetical protein
MPRGPKGEKRPETLPPFHRPVPAICTINAPAFAQSHQPVFHNLSTNLSTGCTRHCEEQSDEAIQFGLSRTVWIALRSLSSGGAEPVIGRAFARPVGADPLARNDDVAAPTAIT